MSYVEKTIYPEKIRDFPGLSPRNFVEIPEGDIQYTDDDIRKEEVKMTDFCFEDIIGKTKTNKLKKEV